jgi:hypothetical protein
VNRAIAAWTFIWGVAGIGDAAALPIELIVNALEQQIPNTEKAKTAAELVEA